MNDTQKLTIAGSMCVVLAIALIVTSVGWANAAKHATKTKPAGSVNVSEYYPDVPSTQWNEHVDMTTLDESAPVVPVILPLSV
jgi:F0F1-type ATP synthase membrane subunit a